MKKTTIIAALLVLAALTGRARTATIQTDSTALKDGSVMEGFYARYSVAITDTLKETTVKATRFLFVTKNDTTIYDLDALNLTNGALLRDAFEKLPGMSFRNGSLYHNGREVKRVLVNGMDFSTKNPLLALQALPSYIMKDVKVYERKSDFAMRYDIEDGSGELVADVSMRRKYMGTWTGEMTAGGGTGKRFMGKAFANTFTDRFRVSLFGNANNINEQMWYNGDGKERAGQTQAGDNHFYTPGGTFFWKNKKTLKEKGYFKIEGSADYNRELYDKGDNQNSERYLSDGTMFSASDTHRETTADRMSGHLKMDWNLTERLTLNYFGAFDVYRSKGDNYTLKANWNENPISERGNIVDTLKHLLMADSRQPKAIDLQQIRNTLDTDGSNYNHSLALNYSFKRRTFLKLVHTMNHENSDNESYNRTYYKYFNDEAYRSTSINRLLDQAGRKEAQGLNSRIQQFFKVNGFKSFLLHADYQYNREQSSSNEKGFLTDSQTTVTDDETTRNRKENCDLHSIETGLSMAKGMFNAEVEPRFNFRHDEMTYSKRNLPTLSPQKDYRYVSLQTRFRMRSEKTGTLFTQYVIAPNIPKIRSFVTYPDRADPQYILLGNDQLEMGMNHVLTSWYSRNFNKETNRGKITRTLSAHIEFYYRNNDVTNFTTYERNTGVITVKPVNVSGNWDGKADVGFVTPLDVAQHFLLETFARASILRTKTFSVAMEENNTPQPNDNRLYAYSATVKPRLRLAPVDLSVAYELTAENNHGTYASANNKAQWQHLLTGKLNWQLPFRLNLDATLNYHNYAAYATGIRENWVMLDFKIERAFLKEENLFVGIFIHDLFNQNNGFLQTYSATALTQTYQKTLGRYAMLTLKYRFASKKK